ncbi:hypothetical protein AB0H58_00105 [Nocardia neocaledoniensis]|uniref:hypothetical protein n=1 Tax=Nocardia neocaledoniensis TaxID=236511 RepID=UPI0033D3B0AB
MTVRAARTAPAVRERDIVMAREGAVLEGRLRVPLFPIGLVVLAQGGSGDRQNPRHRFAADLLAGHRLATLSIELLTATERRDRAAIFEVERLGRRLAGVLRRLPVVPETRHLPVGLFGTGSMAPAALWAAAEPETGVGAIAVRGGRPDLAGERLARIVAPTLLLVGGTDPRVRAGNLHVADSLGGAVRTTELTAPGRSSRAGQLSWRAAYSAAVWFTEQMTDAAQPARSIAGRRR